MFEDIIIHPESRAALETFLKKPSHAVLIHGPAGNGKTLLAARLAHELLGGGARPPEAHEGYLHIAPEKGVISIETARRVGSFLSLKMPGHAAVRRVVAITDAETLTIPAQQALLKLVEEPPEDAVIILTAENPDKILPTIVSRTQRILIKTPRQEDTLEYLKGQGYETAEATRALALAGGSVGGALALLSGEDADAVTVETVRRIIGLPLFDQLLAVEQEFKDKTRAEKFVELLAGVAESSLHRTATAPAALQWHRISAAAAKAQRDLRRNANAKLVLTELMLAFREN